MSATHLHVVAGVRMRRALPPFLACVVHDVSILLLPYTLDLTFKIQ